MKFHFITMILISLFLWQSCQDIFAQNQPNSNQFKKNLVVQDLELDQIEVIIWCPPGISPGSSQICPEKKLEVNVVTVSKIARTKRLTYYYTVTGGKIIGNGSRVTWNFSGVKPGVYTITVGVGKNGKIQGNTITKTIVLKECPVCDHECDCPLVDIITPQENIFTGDSVVFKASVENGLPKIKFNWTIKNGRIISGQGTPQILVKVEPDTDIRNLTASLEIEGFCVLCPSRFSTKVKISRKE